MKKQGKYILEVAIYILICFLTKTEHLLAGLIVISTLNILEK